MFGKRLLTILLVFSIVSYTFYLPIFAPRAQAVLGVADTGFDIPTIIQDIVASVGMSIAQMMVDNIVKSTVEWAQTGFEGNPAYVTNPKQYFTDIADGVVGDYIGGTDLGFLCSPFQAQIRLSLQKQYTQPTEFQCTLTGIVGNIEGFYGNFSEGGWDGWFAMTQDDSNNPYGSYVNAKIELDTRLASAIGIENQKLSWGDGFRGWSDCIQEDPLTKECLVRDPNVKTPGTIIKGQLDTVLSSPVAKLISVEHINQLVSSFATGLLTRYVFGSKGLFADNSSGDTGSTNISNRTGNIDIDGDGVPDGMDLNFDGRLDDAADVCHHGRTAPSGTPPTSRCIGSSSVTTSPYFAPVCQALDKTVAVLTDFTTFIDTYADQMEGGAALKGNIIGPILALPPGTEFGVPNSGGVDNFIVKADAEIWWSRHNEVETAVSDILSNIRSRSSTYFDNMEIATNRYYNYIGKVSESLIKDGDLDLARKGNGGGGLENLMKQSAYHLRYFREAKAQIGRCENPNVGAVNGIPLPPEVEALPPENPNPTPYPTPTGGEVASLLSDLQAERANYGDPMTPQEIGQMLNTVAWNHRADGWGLSRKTGGNKCPSPAGDIACDVLVHQPTNTWVDVFLGDGHETPQWNVIAPNNDPSRAWTAPAQP